MSERLQSIIININKRIKENKLIKYILPKVGGPYYEGNQATCNTEEDK